MSVIQTHINLTDAKAEKDKKTLSMNLMEIDLRERFYITVI